MKKKISTATVALILIIAVLLFVYVLYVIQPQTFNPSYFFKGVWGTSSSDVFAVGNDARGYSLAVHYDGRSWSKMGTGSVNGLRDVWGTSSSDVFAVGEDGTILHYDGARWSEMRSGTAMDLNAVWGISDKDVFAVGEKGTVRHYDGIAWTVLDNDIEADLEGVWGRATDDLFAVGGEWGSGGRIYHYNGSDWSLLNTTYDTYWHHDVWGTSTEVFVVGESHDPEFLPALLHYDSGKWAAIYPDDIKQALFNFLYGIWGIGSSDVFIAASVLDYGWSGVLHYNGDSWVWKTPSDWDTVNTIITDVWGSSRNDVFAVGTGGIILHYDGNEWSKMHTWALSWLAKWSGVIAGVVAITGVGLWLVRRRRRAGAGQGDRL